MTESNSNINESIDSEDDDEYNYMYYILDILLFCVFILSVSGLLLPLFLLESFDLDKFSTILIIVLKTTILCIAFYFATKIISNQKYSLVAKISSCLPFCGLLATGVYRQEIKAWFPEAIAKIIHSEILNSFLYSAKKILIIIF